MSDTPAIIEDDGFVGLRCPECGKYVAITGPRTADCRNSDCAIDYEIKSLTAEISPVQTGDYQ